MQLARRQTGAIQTNPFCKGDDVFLKSYPSELKEIML